MTKVCFQKYNFSTVPCSFALAIHQCGLERDIELFEAGDATEVGEKGITLRYVGYFVRLNLQLTGS